MCCTVVRHSLPFLFPLVLLKLNGPCFKNSGLSKTLLKLSPFFPARLFCSPDKYDVSLSAGAVEKLSERDWFRSHPRERSKERCWLAFLLESLNRMPPSLHCVPISPSLPVRPYDNKTQRSLSCKALQMTLLLSCACVLLLPTR